MHVVDGEPGPCRAASSWLPYTPTLGVRSRSSGSIQLGCRSPSVTTASTSCCSATAAGSTCVGRSGDRERPSASQFPDGPLRGARRAPRIAGERDRRRLPRGRPSAGTPTAPARTPRRGWRRSTGPTTSCGPRAQHAPARRARRRRARPRRLAGGRDAAARSAELLDHAEPRGGRAARHAGVHLGEPARDRRAHRPAPAVAARRRAGGARALAAVAQRRPRSSTAPSASAPR